MRTDRILVSTASPRMRTNSTIPMGKTNHEGWDREEHASWPLSNQLDTNLTRYSRSHATLESVHFLGMVERSPLSTCLWAFNLMDKSVVERDCRTPFRITGSKSNAKADPHGNYPIHIYSLSYQNRWDELLYRSAGITFFRSVAQRVVTRLWECPDRKSLQESCLRLCLSTIPANRGKGPPSLLDKSFDNIYRWNCYLLFVRTLKNIAHYPLDEPPSSLSWTH